MTRTDGSVVVRQDSGTRHMNGLMRHMETDGPGVEFPWNVQYRIQNDDPGIALEPGESNVVDMSLAIPDWITAVDVRCTMVLIKGQGGPDYVWTNRSPHDISVRQANGEYTG